MEVYECSGEAEFMSMVKIGISFKPKRSVFGSAKKESVSSISENNCLALVKVLLMGNPSTQDFILQILVCGSAHLTTSTY